ncbi:hypothetical protein K435DRAFT_102904 [Dendrothele bispora CBS 962.96]|uniref:Uncharacterized protein n=1 Tax=Dendrothele bispora (strain CBS 962.96) TaxID=1314807 RepID=A0A4S8L3D9_DENBC|nr:hypothetical protein K435DRAFT_440963 [Dendrothele bispora CBS 962.96]THU96164.1 hypothetical protein K435DRAFT_102904 [Dendrothele bispora CBS 962.96]
MTRSPRQTKRWPKRRGPHTLVLRYYYLGSLLVHSDFHVTQNLVSASLVLHYQPHPGIHDNTRILITRSRFSTTMTFQLKSANSA